MQIISLLIGITIIYFLQAFLYARFWNYNLRAVVDFAKSVITEGDVITIEESVENRKWLPLPMIAIKYNISAAFFEKGVKSSKVSDRCNRNEVFSILMHQRIKRKTEFVCTRRGVYGIEDLSVQVGNLFLNETNMQDVESESVLIVYPKRVDLNRFTIMFQNIYGNILTNMFMMEDPFINRGVREYQIYDRMKMINWSASAKTGELKVNILEHTSRREIVIMVNLQRDSLLLGSDVSEESIRLAKTFAEMLMNQGIKSCIYTNGRNIKTGEPVIVNNFESCHSYIDVVNFSLAHILVKESGNVYNTDDDDNFCDMYKELVFNLAKDRYIIFISNYQRDDFRKMLLQLKNEGRDFSWIVPVANRKDYHPGNEFQKEAKIWRINWEGTYKGGSLDSN